MSKIKIEQISVGRLSCHILVKDIQHNIFVLGSNEYGQLGPGNSKFEIPCKMD